MDEEDMRERLLQLEADMQYVLAALRHLEHDGIMLQLGPGLDRPQSLQDFATWCQDQLIMLRTFVVGLLERHPEMFDPEDLAYLDEHGFLPRRYEAGLL
jgi:hypothetical protein